MENTNIESQLQSVLLTSIDFMLQIPNYWQVKELAFVLSPPTYVNVLG